MHVHILRDTCYWTADAVYFISEFARFKRPGRVARRQQVPPGLLPRARIVYTRLVAGEFLIGEGVGILREGLFFALLALLQRLGAPAPQHHHAAVPAAAKR